MTVSSPSQPPPPNHLIPRRPFPCPHLGRVGAVGLVEQGPDLRFHGLPPGDGAFEVVLLEAKLARQLLLRGLLRVQVQSLQHRQSLLGVTVLDRGMGERKRKP